MDLAPKRDVIFCWFIFLDKCDPVHVLTAQMICENIQEPRSRMLHACVDPIHKIPKPVEMADSKPTYKTLKPSEEADSNPTLRRISLP
jgi:hypothetical protein